MKVYFAAHGTSQDNEAEIASGWKDTQLSELGKKQAKELGERFKDIKIDLICCSDLKRARQTVDLAFGSKYPIITDPRLRELNYGDFNGKPSAQVGYMKKERINTPFPNGESYEQAMVRVQGLYKELKENHPHETILVVGHRATQFGLDILTGKTLNECLAVPFKWQPFWKYEI